MRQSIELTERFSFGYALSVTSKKGVIGFSGPTNQRLRPQRHRTSCGLFTRAPFMVTRVGVPQGTQVSAPLVRLSANPTSGCRLLSGRWQSKFQRTLEPLMANPTTGAPARMLSITRKRFPRQSCEPTRLPFVRDVKVSQRRTQRKFWHVPKVDCYGTANILGAQYAADWIQYTRENPEIAGSGFLGWIAQEMAQQAVDDECKSHGIAVGFWSLIEQALYQSSLDHYAAAESAASRISATLNEES